MPLFKGAAREVAVETMERSHKVLSSAVGIGMDNGVGISHGLGLVSARFLDPCWGSSRGPTPDELEAELRRLVVDGSETGVTFADFPYYISEEMQMTLTSAAYPHLDETVVPKPVHGQSKTANRTVLLCGLSEFCMQSLAKAVAHQFNVRLLILDVLELAKQIKHKYDCPENPRAVIGGTSDSILDRLYRWIERVNFLSKKVEPIGSSRHGKGILDFNSRDCPESLLPGSKDHDDSESEEEIEFVPPCWYVDEKTLMLTLYKVVASISECSPVILYIRDVNIFLGYSERVYSMFEKMLNKLPGRVLIIGSHFISGDSDQEMADVDEVVSDLFAYILRTKPPEDMAQYKKWKTQMENDYAKVNTDMFVKAVTHVLSANNLDCDDLSSVSPKEYKAIYTELFDILPLAVYYHLMNDKDPKFRNGKLLISSTSLSHGLRIFQENKRRNDTMLKKDESKQDKKAKQVTLKDERAESSQNGGKYAVKDEQVGKPGWSGDEGIVEKGAKVESGENIALRPLTMEDKKQAKAEVGPSFASKGSVMNDIKQWNELYGNAG